VGKILKEKKIYRKKNKVEKGFLKIQKELKDGKLIRK
jgi:hypothetical protein